MSAGAKLLTLAHNQWCAFETDEVRGMFDWQSVVVKGPFSPRDSPLAEWNEDRALAALRRASHSRRMVSERRATGTPSTLTVARLNAVRPSGCR